MKSLYITSVERHSGKTATCLALARNFQARGFQVGYLKPLSLQPWRYGDRIVDEDAAFVKEVLELPTEVWELSPVVVTDQFLREHLKVDAGEAMIERVVEAFRKASANQDIMLLEGGGSLREGYGVDLPTPVVAAALESDVLAIVKYRDNNRVIDDAIAAQTRLGENLRGIILNRVPQESLPFIEEDAGPFFKRRGIRVLGILPEQRGLEALTMSEILEVLQGDVLTPVFHPDALVETLTVGAMTAEAALSIFRRQVNKAVITGGDRGDIQLAALETSTTCLVLTGNLRPSPLIVKQAEVLGVDIILVPTTTIETVETLERIFGKTRLGVEAKLKQFEDLFSQHIDWDTLYQAFGLER